MIYYKKNKNKANTHQMENFLRPYDKTDIRDSTFQKNKYYLFDNNRLSIYNDITGELLYTRFHNKYKTIVPRQFNEKPLFIL